MDDAAAEGPPMTSLERLLGHCAALGRLTGEPGGRPSARERLELAVGPDLAAVLVGALAGDHRPRPWGLRS